MQLLQWLRITFTQLLGDVFDRGILGLPGPDSLLHGLDLRRG
jgi:hypothetical protein